MGVISKADFARLCNVTPGRVSQWISARQISGDAIVGEGRSARIDSDIAMRQLGLTLDLDQRGGNGAKTILIAPVASTAQPPARGEELPPANSVDRLYQEEKLAKIQRENRQAAVAEAVDNGQLCEVAVARAQAGREVAQVVVRIEGSLPQIATAIAAQFKLPQRDVLHLLRAEWRKARAGAAIEARERAEPLPETVGFEVVET